MLMHLFLLGYKQRFIVVPIVLLLTVFLFSGLPHLKVNTDLDSMVPANSVDRIAYQRVQEEFGPDNKTIIYVQEELLWTPEKLAALADLHHAIAGVAGVAEVESLLNVRTLKRNAGRISSGPVISELPASIEQAQQLRDIALQNRLLRGSFLSANGHSTALVVSFGNAGLEGEAAEQRYQQIESALASHRPQFSRLFQTGPARMNSELQTNLYRDLLMLGSLSALVLLLTVLISLRSLLAALIPLITSVLAMIWTFGLLGWLGMPVNILSAMLPSLIMVIAATGSIQLVLAYIRAHAQTDRQDHTEILTRIARQAGLPLLLTLLTIVLGFASNIFNDIGLIQQFAITSAIAVLANGILTLVLVPTLLSLFSRAPRHYFQQRSDNNRFPGILVRLLRQTQVRFPRRILVVTVIACGFFFYHASTLYVTNDPVSYFSARHPLVQDINLIHDELAGVNQFYITLESNAEGAFLDPRNIEKLAEVQAFVREQGVFDQSRSFADYLSLVHRELQGVQPGSPLPATRQLVTQYMMLFHRSEVDSYVSQDYSRANIIVRHNINDSRLLNQYADELRSVVNHIAGGGLVAHIVGQNLMINQAADTLKSGQINALMVLLTLIFIIVSVLFTSVKGGLIALVPAIVPIALMFGMMGLLGIPLNPGSVMVAVIAIGLAVDGTIHLLSRYNELCRKTSDYTAAVATAVTDVAPALIISGLALALGFSILIFSGFTVIAQFGALLTATMLFSILANLLITPVLMTRIRLVGLYQILTMSLDEDMLAKSTLFHGMTEYQRRKAILISELHEFREGERLIEQDTTGRSMYLILTGIADVVRRDGDDSHVLATLGPGQVFGEIGYIRETHRTADVVATSDITALKFDYQRMQKDLKYFPNIVAKLNFNISYILGKRLADMVEQSRK
jgi:hydrophobe/amphiphile efflux-3 (HAE3) family protein